MIIPVMLFLGLALLVFFVLRNPRDNTLQRSFEARMLVTGTQVLLCVNTLFWTILGIGEIRAEDIYGWLHLIVAILLIGYTILVRRRIFEPGVILAAIGIALTTYNFFYMEGTTIDKLNASLICGIPFLIFGIFLLTATWFAWRKPPEE